MFDLAMDECGEIFFALEKRLVGRLSHVVEHQRRFNTLGTE